VDGLKYEPDTKIADDNHLWIAISYKVNHIGFSFRSLEKTTHIYLKGGKRYD